MLPFSTFSTEKGVEDLGLSCAESSRAQEIQVYIYPKAAALSGLGCASSLSQSTWTHSLARQAGEVGPWSWNALAGAGPSPALGVSLAQSVTLWIGLHLSPSEFSLGLSPGVPRAPASEPLGLLTLPDLQNAGRGHPAGVCGTQVGARLPPETQNC